jgi:CRISPR-associated protein Csb3
MTTEPSIRIAVDPTNPGQFFACCGLLELADRLWNGAEGWFEPGEFCLQATPLSEPTALAAGQSTSSPESGTTPDPLATLIAAVRNTPFAKDDPKNPLYGEETVAPLRLGDPFNLRLDWWNDSRASGDTFKTWAGRQEVVRIARSMHAAIDPEIHRSKTLLQHAALLIDVDDARKTAAPFYFDSRAASQAGNIDVGFSTDAQGISVPVFAAVEFLCLVGLQRFRPRETRDGRDRIYSYFTWPCDSPLSPAVATAVASGVARIPGAAEYRFRMLFRTKYLKGFLPSQPQHQRA